MCTKGCFSQIWSHTVWCKILKVDKSGLGKFLQVQIDECQCVSFIIILIIMLTRVCFFISYTYNYIDSYVARISLILICTYICTCIIIDININQPYLFWVAAGYVQAWSRAHDITSQVRALVCMCAVTMEHSFTIDLIIRGYHVYKDG